MAASMKGVTIDSEESNKHPTEREIHEYPWKYIGYQGFTAYAAADADFFALRRFDRLHSRSLFILQDQLSELEGRLDHMDVTFSSKDVKISGTHPPQIVNLGEVQLGKKGNGLRDINNGTIRDDLQERSTLLAEITVKLKEYDKAVLRYSHMRKIVQAPKRNIRNIEGWFEDNEGAIMEDETKFIRHRDEIICMSTPKSTARRWFEDQIICRANGKLGLFRKQQHDGTKFSNRNLSTMYTFNDKAVDVFESLAVFLTATAMLIAPLWILDSLSSLRLKLVVITVFVILCLGFLSLTALGRPFEKLAATAGYSAVLVVFLQIGS
ncbi:hypothetical protein F5Y16DRAFT_367292 [Xylariaceae sp. FL0255]|nr:hypothetical protein F5Y16DRAFT_367292 [Xylariaceae sp. FL0255]